MIPIETLYKRTTNDLLRKGKGGYISSEEFNRAVSDAQNMLQNFYLSKLDSDIKYLNHLSPFVKEKICAVNNSCLVVLPGNFRRHLELSYYNIPDADCDSDEIDTKARYPAYFVKSNEEYLTVTSPIRKASGTRILYTVLDGALRVTGAESNRVYVKYIIHPPVAVRGYTPNLTTDREDYDPSTTVDLIWNSQDEVNLRDILLLNQGIQIRESELLQWLSASRQISGQ